MVAEPQAKHLVQKPLPPRQRSQQSIRLRKRCWRHPCYEAPPVSQEGVISMRLLGTVEPVPPVPTDGAFAPETTGLPIQPALRANRTQCSIGLGSVKYMTPPSFSPSAGITLKPWFASTPSTSLSL